jgi:hypothetical protein
VSLEFLKRGSDTEGNTTQGNRRLRVQDGYVSDSPTPHQYSFTRQRRGSANELDRTLRREPIGHCSNNICELMVRCSGCMYPGGCGFRCPERLRARGTWGCLVALTCLDSSSSAASPCANRNNSRSSAFSFSSRASSVSRSSAQSSVGGVTL